MTSVSRVLEVPVWLLRPYSLLVLALLCRVWVLYTEGYKTPSTLGSVTIRQRPIHTQKLLMLTDSSVGKCAVTAYSVMME